MTWKLERIGTVVLPVALPETPIGTGPSRDTIQETGGGFYDAAGDGRAELQLPYDLSYRVIATAATNAALLTTLRALKAQRGKLAKLYRRASDDAVEWCYARLTRVPADRTVEHIVHQPIEFVWRVESPWYSVFHGAGWVLDAGYYLDAGMYLDTDETHPLTGGGATNVITVTNGGDTDATNVIIRVKAGSAAITNGGAVALSIYITALTSLEFTGTIASGNTLVIDTGRKSALNNGVAAGSTFRTGTGHKSNYWLPLAPGANSVNVLTQGGGANSEITFEFSEPRE